MPSCLRSVRDPSETTPAHPDPRRTDLPTHHWDGMTEATREEVAAVEEGAREETIGATPLNLSPLIPSRRHPCLARYRLHWRDRPARRLLRQH